jgi:hypothetical protein
LGHGTFIGIGDYGFVFPVGGFASFALYVWRR